MKTTSLGILELLEFGSPPKVFILARIWRWPCRQQHLMRQLRRVKATKYLAQKGVFMSYCYVKNVNNVPYMRARRERATLILV